MQWQKIRDLKKDESGLQTSIYFVFCKIPSTSGTNLVLSGTHVSSQISTWWRPTKRWLSSSSPVPISQFIIIAQSWSPGTSNRSYNPTSRSRLSTVQPVEKYFPFSLTGMRKHHLSKLWFCLHGALDGQRLFRSKSTAAFLLLNSSSRSPRTKQDPSCNIPGRKSIL